MCKKKTKTFNLYPALTSILMWTCVPHGTYFHFCIANKHDPCRHVKSIYNNNSINNNNKLSPWQLLQIGMCHEKKINTG